MALDICFAIHRQYGPGYLKVFLKKYFVMNGQRLEFPFKRQCGISVVHEDIKMDLGFRADVILKDKVIIEIKSIDSLADIHF